MNGQSRRLPGAADDINLIGERIISNAAIEWRASQAVGIFWQIAPALRRQTPAGGQMRKTIRQQDRYGGDGTGHGASGIADNDSVRPGVIGGGVGNRQDGI